MILPDEKLTEPPKKREGWTAEELAGLAEAEAKLAAAKLAAAKSAAEAEAEKEYEAAAAEAEAPQGGDSFAHRYENDQIFSREMGEPEFFLLKKDLVPPRPIRTREEEKEISRKALIPKDVTPPYNPKYILSPEFAGTSNYEQGIETTRKEIEEKLKRLRTEPDTNQQEIQLAEADLKTLDDLIENYHMGMNVFRTAQGGRSKLRE